MNKKISQLSTATNISTTDIFPLVTNLATTPTNESVSWDIIRTTIADYLAGTMEFKNTTIVGSNSADYPTTGTADDLQLNAAILEAHNNGGGHVHYNTALNLSNIITLYKDVKVTGRGELTPISIASNFAAGVVMRDQSGDSENLSLDNITIDLAGKSNVGGIHIYQGNFVKIRNLTVKNQGYTNASKWTVRVGNYVNGSPDSTASRGTIIENLRIINCNSGTFEQLLFVNQQDARIINPYFENNTNSLAYELMLYVNNKNVVVENPHFESPSANSIGIMESDGIQINNITGDYDENRTVGTIINTRNVIINGITVNNTVSSPTASLFNFFDRTLGPDGFTQIVEDTERVLIENVHVEGWKSIATLQTIGTVSGTGYTGNQNNIRFRNIFSKGMSVPFNLGIDHVDNHLNNFDFENIRILTWNGATTGAWQLRGYITDVTQMYGFRFKNCYVASSTGGGSSAAIRNIGATVESVTDSDFSATFTTYGALSSVSGGVFQQVKNVKGLNPDIGYNQGDVTGATTFNRANGDHILARLTGNITVTLTNGTAIGDELTLRLTQDGTGSRLVTWPSNFKKVGGTLTLSTAISAVDQIRMRWDGTNWNEVSRAMALS